MKYKIVTCFLLSLVFIYGSSSEIEVTLSTESSLHPLYLSQVQTINSQLLQNYPNEARKVLQFDLENCGYFQLLSHDENLESLCLSLKGNQIFSNKSLQDSKVQILVSLKIVEKKLFVTLLTKSLKKLITCDPIVLTGHLPEDRRFIHQLSDAIVKELLNKKGIASSKILFSVKKPNSAESGPRWLSEIWMSDYDGENSRQITFENSLSIHPLFLPKKGIIDQFIYVSYRTGQPKIYLSNLQRKKASIPLLPIRGNQLLPAISILGDKISFICDAGGRADLFVQKFEKNKVIGKPKQLFSYPRATQASPSFSPDGKKLAFVSDKDGAPKIYVISINEDETKRATPELITKKNIQNVSPSWSFDGKKLAYSAMTDGIRQIWIYDFETKQEWQLTFGPNHKENPTWASNSLHLCYNTDEKNSCEIFLININQKQSVCISSGFGKKRFPSWEPL